MVKLMDSSRASIVSEILANSPHGMTYETVMAVNRRVSNNGSPQFQQNLTGIYHMNCKMLIRCAKLRILLIGRSRIPLSWQGWTDTAD